MIQASGHFTVRREFPVGGACSTLGFPPQLDVLVGEGVW